MSTLIRPPDKGVENPKSDEGSGVWNKRWLLPFFILGVFLLLWITILAPTRQEQSIPEAAGIGNVPPVSDTPPVNTATVIPVPDATQPPDITTTTINTGISIPVAPVDQPVLSVPLEIMPEIISNQTKRMEAIVRENEALPREERSKLAPTAETIRKMKKERVILL